MSRQRPINETYSTVLDSSGSGSIWFGAHGRDVQISRLFVRAMPANQEGQCVIYEQFQDSAYTLYTTQKAASGDSQETDLTLTDGYGLWIVWKYSSPNATATVRVVGIESKG